jgi:hypothetical protein
MERLEPLAIERNGVAVFEMDEKPAELQHRRPARARGEVLLAPQQTQL